MVYAVKEQGTPGGSVIRWQDGPPDEGGATGDTPASILPLVVARLRELNRDEPTKSREKSLAITHCQEALHWLRDEASS